MFVSPRGVVLTSAIAGTGKTMPATDTNRNMCNPTDRARLPVPVIDWREQRLRAAGFPAGPARRLARDRAYDLHALIELAERGCPSHLAERIAAPLSGGAVRLRTPRSGGMT